MGFQSNVETLRGFGVQGELFLDGPVRAAPFTLISTPNINTVGNAFTITSEGVATVGGTGVFGGILVNPKHYATSGTSSGTLTPTLDLPDNSMGELLDMGQIIVYLNSAANIGDGVVYDQTTGALSALVLTGTPAAGSAFIPNAVVDRYTLASAGLGVIRLTN